MANEPAWQRARWRDINHRWLGPAHAPEDFRGRFKVVWTSEKIYILAELVDDVLFDGHRDPLVQYWDDDCLEIFLDEDYSGGDHQYNHNAFAYHVSLDNQAIDIGTDKSPRSYSHHVQSRWRARGDTIVWELAIDVYDDAYVDGSDDNAPVELSPGKVIGLMVAWCDNDGSELRENFIGSESAPGDNKDRGWIDAGLFGKLLLVAPLQAEGGATEIVFASAPDGTGTVQRLVDAFNESNRGTVHVTWRQMSPETDAHRRQLVKELSSGRSAIDLIAADVIWTAEFANERWAEDVTDRFYGAYDRHSFLAPALESATYRLRLWGVPWYTDAGLLFYRKDKLAQSGFTAPPTTWEGLARMARKVMQDTGTRYGFVFQGAQYEGGTANAAEFIWSAGGELMTSRVTVTGVVVQDVIETDSVLVGSDKAARGLDIARKLVAEGVAPAAVARFRERQGLNAFVAGDAVFLRSWPYVYAALMKEGFTPEQFGVASLPAASDGGRSASCLGGWNLMINARSSKSERDAAWSFIRYLTAPAQQKRQARGAGLLPILSDLYEDSDLVEEVPVMGRGKEVFTSQLHARPASPFYSEMSAAIARAFNRTLKGELTGSEAARILDEELSAIVVRNR